MNPFEMPTSSQSADWMFFAVILLAVGIGITCFIIWFYMSSKSAKKQHRKRRHRHDRQHNPTLSETGGLPPRRDFNQPPRGT